MSVSNSIGSLSSAFFDDLNGFRVELEKEVALLKESCEMPADTENAPDYAILNTLHNDMNTLHSDLNILEDNTMGPAFQCDQATSVKEVIVRCNTLFLANQAFINKVHQTKDPEYSPTKSLSADQNVQVSLPSTPAVSTPARPDRVSDTMEEASPLTPNIADLTMSTHHHFGTSIMHKYVESPGAGTMQMQRSDDIPASGGNIVATPSNCVNVSEVHL